MEGEGAWRINGVRVQRTHRGLCTGCLRPWGFAEGKMRPELRGCAVRVLWVCLVLSHYFPFVSKSKPFCILLFQMVIFPVRFSGKLTFIEKVTLNASHSRAPFASARCWRLRRSWFWLNAEAGRWKHSTNRPLWSGAHSVQVAGRAAALRAELCVARAPGKGPWSAEPLRSKGPGDVWPRQGHPETQQVLMTLPEDLTRSGCTDCEGKSSRNLLAGTSSSC